MTHNHARSIFQNGGMQPQPISPDYHDDNEDPYDMNPFDEDEFDDDPQEDYEEPVDSGQPPNQFAPPPRKAPPPLPADDGPSHPSSRTPSFHGKTVPPLPPRGGEAAALPSRAMAPPIPSRGVGKPPPPTPVTPSRPPAPIEHQAESDSDGQEEYEVLPDVSPGPPPLPAPRDPYVDEHQPEVYEDMPEINEPQRSPAPLPGGGMSPFNRAPPPIPQSDEIYEQTDEQDGEVYEDPDAKMKRGPAARIPPLPSPGGSSNQAAAPPLPPMRKNSAPAFVENYEELPEGGEVYEVTEEEGSGGSAQSWRSPPRTPSVGGDSPQLPPPRGRPQPAKPAGHKAPKGPGIAVGSDTIKNAMTKLKPTARTVFETPSSPPPPPAEEAAPVNDFRSKMNLFEGGAAAVKNPPKPPRLIPATGPKSPPPPLILHHQKNLERSSTVSTGSTASSDSGVGSMTGNISPGVRQGFPMPGGGGSSTYPEPPSPSDHLSSIPDEVPPPPPMNVATTNSSFHSARAKVAANLAGWAESQEPLSPTQPLSSMPEGPPPPPPMTSIAKEPNNNVATVPPTRRELPPPTLPEVPTRTHTPPEPGRMRNVLPPVPVEQELEGLYSYNWYHGDIERKEAEFKIKSLGVNGTYLVRKSKKGGLENPYTLTLWYNKIFHLHIRKRPDQKFALGSKKEGEEAFTSVPDLIRFHNENELMLTGHDGQCTARTRLTKAPTKR